METSVFEDGVFVQMEELAEELSKLRQKQTRTRATPTHSSQSGDDARFVPESQHVHLELAHTSLVVSDEQVLGSRQWSNGVRGSLRQRMERSLARFERN